MSDNIAVQQSFLSPSKVPFSVDNGGGALQQDKTPVGSPLPFMIRTDSGDSDLLSPNPGSFLDTLSPEEQVSCLKEHVYQLQQALLQSEEKEDASRAKLKAKTSAYADLQKQVAELLINEASEEGSAKEEVKALSKMVEAEKLLREVAEDTLRHRDEAIAELRSEMPALKAEAEASLQLRLELQQAKVQAAQMESQYASAKRQLEELSSSSESREVWRQLSELQEQHAALTLEAESLRAAKQELGSLKDFTHLVEAGEGAEGTLGPLAGGSAELRSASRRLVQERDHALAASRSWQVRCEKAQQELSAARAELDGDQGLRAANHSLAAANSALQALADTVPALKEESMRRASEIVQLRAELERVAEQQARRDATLAALQAQSASTGQAVVDRPVAGQQQIQTIQGPASAPAPAPASDVASTALVSTSAPAGEGAAGGGVRRVMGLGRVMRSGGAPGGGAPLSRMPGAGVRHGAGAPVGAATKGGGNDWLERQFNWNKDRLAAKGRP